jgi:AcrR family transcriptional regulator
MTETSTQTNDVPLEKGIRTRNHILGYSVDIASAEGLEGLTIGKLARELKMSKSGLFAHFGSKEDLQIATVREAREVFIREIVAPTESVAAGVKRLTQLLNNWIVHVEKSVFRGGCFFFAVSAEMDDRPGRVKDLIAHLTMSWVNLIEGEISAARENGEILNDSDVEMLAFRFHGFVQEANWFFRLHGRSDAFRMARRSIEEELIRVGAKKELLGELS